MNGWQRAPACLYCDRHFVLEYGDWHLCGVCSADFIASLKPPPIHDRMLEIHRAREAWRHTHIDQGATE